MAKVSVRITAYEKEKALLSENLSNLSPEERDLKLALVACIDAQIADLTGVCDRIRVELYSNKTPATVGKPE